MVKRKTALKIRKVHRYLGLFLGLQFLMWTISGLYFSWTNLDEIHGDHFKNLEKTEASFKDLINPSSLDIAEGIKSLEIRNIDNTPYYWLNDKYLFNAKNGLYREEISPDEALAVAGKNMKPGLEVQSIDKITEVDAHHEYREKLLPAYVLTYKSDESLKAYVSTRDGKFQTVRHRAWRWFDFLWMTHTMDYETRDNFNTTVLRVFSLMGLITVLSGFILFYISSSTIRKIKKKFNNAINT